MRLLGAFEAAQGEYRRAVRVVVRTERGLELGEVLCEAREETLAHLQASGGQILRQASTGDLIEARRLRDQELHEFEVCQQLVGKLQLQMQLVDVEHLFGGERIIFYFLAEKRVDFRELVRELAREFRTRIEMRQIGVRDEAKLLADYGDCGRPVCCNTFLTSMPPVSMRMAKMQKSTVDPAKISGRCGRLKCCLRYEMETYEELLKLLPPVGAQVVTSKGSGTVLSQDILSQRVVVEFEDGRRLTVSRQELLPS
ncbi:MAG: signal peptidase [Gemmataceae bacterium]